MQYFSKKPGFCVQEYHDLYQIRLHRPGMGRAGLYNLSILIKYLGEPAPTKIYIILGRIKRK